MDKDKMPAKKRVRFPTQKMKDLQSSPPPNDTSGRFAFVRWEDGYTGKIFTTSDILARDEAPVQLQNLKTGDPVLAKWSDGKFYKATVEYISGENKAKPPTGNPSPPESFLSMLKGDETSDSTSGSDTIIIDRSPQSEHGEKIPSLNPSPDGGHATGHNTSGPPANGSHKRGTIDPSAYNGNAPSLSASGPCTSDPSPYGTHTPSPPAYVLTTSSPSPYGTHKPSPPGYGLNTSGPSPYGTHTPNPPGYGLNTSGPSSYGTHIPSPPAYGPNTSGPSPYGTHTPSPPGYGPNTSGPSPYGTHTPSPPGYGPNTSGPSPYGTHIPSPPAYGPNTSGPSPYGTHIPSPPAYGPNTSGPSPYGTHTPSPPGYDPNTSGPSPYGSHTPSPPGYGPNTSGPSPYGSHTPSPSAYGFNTAGPQAIEVSPPDSGKAAHLSLDRRDAGRSADTGNSPFAKQAGNAWTPCDGCKGEFERITREKRRIDEVLSRIDPTQVRELQTLCDLIEEKHHDNPSSPSGQQELFPGAGVFISSFRLAAMNQASKPHCMRLFHALFDHFFTVEECQNAVPFGRPGNNPLGQEGKRILDRKKVDGILTYVLRCASLPGWEKIEEAKLKKAFVNKCRARAGSKE